MVLGFNCADSREHALKFIEDFGVTYDNVLDTSMAANQIMMKYETLGGMSAVPMTYVIDPEGKVVDAWYGYQDGKMKQLLEELGLEER